jgi:translation elongation factor EF-Tu-like GTPase
LTILGDDTRLAILQKMADETKASPEVKDSSLSLNCPLGARPVLITTAKSNDLLVKARLAAMADAAVLAMDSTIGPLPIHREDVLLARQMGIPTIVISLTKTARVLDPELLDLEELEAREILNKYRMSGDQALCIADSIDSQHRGRLKVRKDFAALAEFVQQLSVRPLLPAPRYAVAADAAFYVLTNPELYLRGVDRAPQSGQYQLLLGEQEVDGTISFASTVDFGANVEGTIQFVTSTKSFAGQRLVVLRDGHIAAAGVVTRIHERP